MSVFLEVIGIILMSCLTAVAVGGAVAALFAFYKLITSPDD